MKKLALAAIGLLFSTLANAQFFEVNVWDPFPGKGPATFANAEKAKAIHEKHGGQVFIANDGVGHLYYGIAFENYQAQNEFYNKLNQDPEWEAFWAEANKDPSAELIDHQIIDIVAASEGDEGDEPSTVYMRATWQPIPGKAAKMFENAMQAKAIHEKMGASVLVGASDLNELVYVLNFRDWSHFAEFMDSPAEEFQAFMSKAGADPSAVLVDSARGSLQ